MRFSDFIRYYKCATMLLAQDRMINIQDISFPDMKKEKRDNIWRSIKTASEFYIFKEAKDFSEVASNLARKLMNRG
jgi:hypothetical protein